MSNTHFFNRIPKPLFRICVVVLACAMVVCGSTAEAEASNSAFSSAARPRIALFGLGKSSGQSDSGKSSNGGQSAGNGQSFGSGQNTGSDKSSSSGGTGSSGSSAGSGGSASAGGSYKIPAFRNAIFDASAAEGNSEAAVDTSSCSEGYVAMRCNSNSKIKFQVVKGDMTYTYSVVTGADQVFPLQMGDGHYTFKVMENIGDNKYVELFKCEADVTIKDPLDPFLRPNQYTNYTEQSETVKKARSFAESASGVQDFVYQVYDYVCDNVTYDKERAASVKSGYLPDPDKTLFEKKGICFDYASLAAAMLRSQGVPTKIIFGYVAPNDVYHAWNKFYTEEGGWTLVEFKVTGKDWNRIDLTFSANGGDSKFIGDGSNYMEAYVF